MPVLLSAAVLCIGAILQSTLLPHFAVLGVKVDLVLLLVAAWSIRRGVEAGLVWAMIRSEERSTSCRPDRLACRS